MSNSVKLSASRLSGVVGELMNVTGRLTVNTQTACDDAHGMTGDGHDSRQLRRVMAMKTDSI